MATAFPLLFAAEPDRLLRKVSAGIDDDMLREIAHADYSHRANEHLAVLLRMRDEGFIPSPQHVPQEVLELIRWSEPDHPDHKPGGTGERGHWMRAFCCAFLLRMAAENDPGFFSSFNETVSGLVASLEAVEKDLWSETGSLLTWFVMRTTATPHDDEDAFLGVAILYCALRGSSPTDALLIDICKWISEREEAVSGQGGIENAWLHRITPHDQRRGTWKELGRTMGRIDLRSRSPEAREWIGRITTSLAAE